MGCNAMQFFRALILTDRETLPYILKRGSTSPTRRCGQLIHLGLLASIRQLVQHKSKRPKEQPQYRHFCAQYMAHDSMQRPRFSKSRSSSITLRPIHHHRLPLHHQSNPPRACDPRAASRNSLRSAGLEAHDSFVAFRRHCCSRPARSRSRPPPLAAADSTRD